MSPGPQIPILTWRVGAAPKKRAVWPTKRPEPKPPPSSDSIETDNEMGEGAPQKRLASLSTAFQLTGLHLSPSQAHAVYFSHESLGKQPPAVSVWFDLFGMPLSGPNNFILQGSLEHAQLSRSRCLMFLATAESALAAARGHESLAAVSAMACGYQSLQQEIATQGELTGSILSTLTFIACNDTVRGGLVHRTAYERVLVAHGGIEAVLHRFHSPMMHYGHLLICTVNDWRPADLTPWHHDLACALEAVATLAGAARDWSHVFQDVTVRGLLDTSPLVNLLQDPIHGADIGRDASPSGYLVALYILVTELWESRNFAGLASAQTLLRTLQASLMAYSIVNDGSHVTLTSSGFLTVLLQTLASQYQRPESRRRALDANECQIQLLLRAIRMLRLWAVLGSENRMALVQFFKNCLCQPGMTRSQPLDLEAFWDDSRMIKHTPVYISLNAFASAYAVQVGQTHWLQMPMDPVRNPGIEKRMDYAPLLLNV
ncbi:hypothetical protein ASPZODRAFT_144378 [Penicilliopsis zonata CBS 506.65]|uniref:Transcription factor domain-containing protein n=1 Tax=Penicilliopsis zonata CBS 506.65 TaxID=1073090 RepID=A0A1L9SD67_9EURO|nr:hypothetical protein ASPZODRAFT_144378 [Penicilliopsis zonata CBS 506.65]OJJ45072.1 hypothetical protein ASPZODRAFT_144378 [Penicilliopsis zonata CBS 506.65]